jgi:hypothetical protein
MSHPLNHEIAPARHARQSEPVSESWWIGIERGPQWTAALQAHQPRLSTSAFGKSHRLALGPNVVAEEAESKFRRSRQELLQQTDGRRVAS